MSSFCAYLLHQSLVTTILTGRSFLPNLTQSRCVMTKVGKMPAKRELKTARFRHSSISESFLYVASENFIPHILNSIEIHICGAMNNSYKQENLEPDDRKSVKQKKAALHYSICTITPTPSRFAASSWEFIRVISNALQTSNTFPSRYLPTRESRSIATEEIIR